VKAYADLGDLPEDERIEVLAQTAQSAVVGFVVEDNAKADRYLLKLGPRVRLIGRGPGPVANTVLVRIGPLES